MRKNELFRVFVKHFKPQSLAFTRLNLMIKRARVRVTYQPLHDSSESELGNSFISNKSHSMFKKVVYGSMEIS